MHDVARRRRRSRENLRAQAEVSMPASSNLFATLFFAKILRTKTRYVPPVPCKCTLKYPEIIDNTLNVPEFILSCFEHVSS